MAAVKARRHSRRVTARLLRHAQRATVAGTPVGVDAHGNTVTLHDDTYRVVAVRKAPGGHTELKVADRPGGPLTTVALDR